LRRYFFPRWQLVNMNAAQLCFLCECLERTRDVPGAVVEVGCAAGVTTVFLNKYMDARRMEKPYVAIDTFAGFVPATIDYEVVHRGERHDHYDQCFPSNKNSWFDGTMRTNGITRVQSSEADVNEFDFARLGAISFCLLDVDLYRPIKHSLPHLYEQLSPRGLVVVDDCNRDHERWDGAFHAYREFVQERCRTLEVVHDELGVIEKET